MSIVVGKKWDANAEHIGRAALFTAWGALVLYALCII